MSDTISTPPPADPGTQDDLPPPASTAPFYTAPQRGLDPIADAPGDSLGVTPVGDFPIHFGGSTLTQWSADEIAGISLDAGNTIPLVRPDRPDFLPDYHMTDHWLVKTPTGEPARIDGNYVVVGLFYPAAGIEGRVEEGNTNTYGYIYSPDGETWKLGGVLVDPRDAAVLGDELFSGSAMWDPATGTLYAYTTNVFDAVASPSVDQPVQKMGVTTFHLDATAAPGELRFDQVDSHVLLEPDGRYYVEPGDAKTGGEVYGFRDPVFFQDPRTGQDYLTFTANLADQPGSNDGVVGIAALDPGEAPDGDWSLLPPLLGAVGTNEQLERPHFVFMDDKYYLFFSTHERTFLGDVAGEGPDGLYGFVGANLWGPYYPLNGTGLVLGNPPDAPTQLYSFSVEKTSEDTAAVLSFVFNYLDAEDGTDATGDFAYGGTPAPVMSILVDGQRTALSSVQAPAPVVADAGDPLVPYLVAGDDGGGTTDPSTPQDGTTDPSTPQDGTTDPSTPQDGTTDPSTPQAAAMAMAMADAGAAPAPDAVDWNAMAAQVMANHAATGQWFL